MPVKYGQVTGPYVPIECCWGASEVSKFKGGGFVSPDGTADAEGRPRVHITVATDTEILGWTDGGEDTASSTEGQTKCIVNISIDAVYRIPRSSGTLAITDVTDVADLAVSGDIQGLAADINTRSLVQILKRESAELALVRMNPNKIAQTTV